MKGLFACMLAALLAAPALAQGPGAVRKQVESSMVVTGSIDVATDGSVSGHRIDRVEDVPSGVRDLIAKAAPRWKFEPVLVDGRPAPARARMSVRLVAKRLDDDRYEVSVRSASFGQDAPGESVEAERLAPPRYPMAAAQAGASGTVYTLVRIGRDGHVVDAFAQQVNLDFVASENAMKRWREVFAKSATTAARGWTFKPPTSGEAAGEDGWVARVPVRYTLGDRPAAETDQYGRWETYVPGPYRPAPWADVKLAGSADALPSSGVFQVGRELRLLTPVGGG